MDEKEIMKRFFGVVNDTIAEKDEFKENVETAIDIYYKHGHLRGQSLEAGCGLAYLRYLIGEHTLNSVFCSMGCKDYMLPRLNRWMTDCLNECGGIDEERKLQIEKELSELR